MLSEEAMRRLRPPPPPPPRPVLDLMAADPDLLEQWREGRFEGEGHAGDRGEQQVGQAQLVRRGDREEGQVQVQSALGGALPVAAAPVDPTRIGRWRAQGMADDYVSLVSDLMYPGNLHGGFGQDNARLQLPLHRVNALGFLLNPVRRPTIIERWSPLEIALFEGAIALFGKYFHIIQQLVKTKTTKECIQFYYIWKTTSHYNMWKKSFIPEWPSEDEYEEDEDEEEGDGGGEEEEQQQQQQQKDQGIGGNLVNSPESGVEQRKRPAVDAAAAAGGGDPDGAGVSALNGQREGVGHKLKKPRKQAGDDSTGTTADGKRQNGNTAAATSARNGRKGGAKRGGAAAKSKGGKPPATAAASKGAGKPRGRPKSVAKAKGSATVRSTGGKKRGAGSKNGAVRGNAKKAAPAPRRRSPAVAAATKQRKRSGSGGANKKKKAETQGDEKVDGEEDEEDEEEEDDEEEEEEDDDDDDESDDPEEGEEDEGDEDGEDDDDSEDESSDSSGSAEDDDSDGGAPGAGDAGNDADDEQDGEDSTSRSAGNGGGGGGSAGGGARGGNEAPPEDDAAPSRVDLATVTPRPVQCPSMLASASTSTSTSALVFLGAPRALSVPRLPAAAKAHRWRSAPNAATTTDVVTSGKLSSLCHVAAPKTTGATGPTENVSPLLFSIIGVDDARR